MPTKTLHYAWFCRVASNPGLAGDLPPTGQASSHQKTGIRFRQKKGGHFYSIQTGGTLLLCRQISACLGQHLSFLLPGPIAETSLFNSNLSVNGKLFFSTRLNRGSITLNSNNNIGPTVTTLFHRSYYVNVGSYAYRRRVICQTANTPADATTVPCFFSSWYFFCCSMITAQSAY